MSDTQALLDCIEAIYDAGTDAERWPHALAMLSVLVRGQSGTLAYFTPHKILMGIVSGIDPALSGRMNDYLEHNLWYQRRRRASLNRAVAGEQLASPAEFKRTPLYADLMREADILHMCGSCSTTRAPISGPLPCFEASVAARSGRAK